MSSLRRWLETRPRVLSFRRHLNRISRLALPAAAIPMIVTARTWVGRRRRGRWEKARASIQFMVGDSVPETRLEKLADGYLRRTSWRAEVRIRPDLITHQEVKGLEHLNAATAAGRGCLLSFMHHGDYIGSFGSIVRAGHDLTLIGDSGLWDPHGLLWQHEHRRALEFVPGTTLIDVATGSAGVREQLGHGAVVAIAVDFPGHTPTRIFGRDLDLSSGGLRIARELDVPVVLMTSERVGSSLRGGARTVLGPVLQPGEFATFEDLHAEAVRTFEQSIHLWPEALEEPLRMDYGHLIRRSTQYGVAG